MLIMDQKTNVPNPMQYQLKLRIIYGNKFLILVVVALNEQQELRKLRRR